MKGILNKDGFETSIYSRRRHAVRSLILFLKKLGVLKIKYPVELTALNMKQLAETDQYVSRYFNKEKSNV